MAKHDVQVRKALAAPYHRLFLKEEDGGFSASVLELDGVYGAGATIDEANRTLEEGLADWVQIELERGHEIPAPLNVETFSGRLTFRIPPTLHYKAAMLAQLEGVSLNRLLSDALAQQISVQAMMLPQDAEMATWSPALKRRSAPRGA
jgi:predicted RNase H-like HicB family nuclease